MPDEKPTLSEAVDVLSEFIRTELLAGNRLQEVTPDENLLISGLVDSIGMMRLVAFVGERFGYNVPPEDVTIENFVSIRAIAEYLERSQS